jgi:glycosyltransferase involved in cell wall biosynthesis
MLSRSRRERAPRGAARRLIVTSFFPRAGEPERGVFVLNLVKELRKRWGVDVVSPWPYTPLIRRRLEARGQRDDVVEGIEVWRPRFLAWPGAQLCNGLTYGAAVSRRLSERSRTERVVIHGHCIYPDGVGVALASWRLGVPFLLTAHGSDINVYSKKATLRPQIRWALRRARGVVAVSGPLRDAVLALTGAGGPPVRHIPCAGFDPAVFAPRPRDEARRRLALPADARVVLFVGHLVHIKGLDVLLEAWARWVGGQSRGRSDLLVLLGTGPEREALERRVARLGLGERVQFKGAVPHSEVPTWLAASDLLCLPSRNEGTPNVVVEALASGRPVVASPVGGVPDLVRDGENGLFATPQDPAALEAALRAALEREWSPVGLRESVAHLTWEALAGQDARFAEECLAEEAA